MMESSGVQGYVSLDDPLRREMATSDPGLFMQNLKLPVLIDEIQYAPQILPYLKMQVDSSNASGQFWLTQRAVKPRPSGRGYKAHLNWNFCL